MSYLAHGNVPGAGSVRGWSTSGDIDMNTGAIITPT